jgi:hypothetical protein
MGNDDNTLRIQKYCLQAKSRGGRGKAATNQKYCKN